MFIIFVLFGWSAITQVLWAI